ncbi:MAG: aldehyde dehydrogenase (NADP(+)), partial [Acidobacteria bacterium]|nr:aldehyde dehydrogenase (NADP(+)) [Acidobacteriota bacterium]
MPGTFHAVNPATSQPMEPQFRDATGADVDAALGAAAAACAPYRAHGPAGISGFLDRIAAEL